MQSKSQNKELQPRDPGLAGLYNELDKLIRFPTDISNSESETDNDNLR